MADLIFHNKQGNPITLTGVSKLAAQNTQGETEEFIQPSGTLTIEENGLHSVKNYAAVDVHVAAKGGAGDSGVFFVDYTGDTIDVWAPDTIAEQTALPDNPQHSRLVAQGWNWTLAEIKAYHAKAPDADIVVGQVYKTASGHTEVDVEVSALVGLTAKCGMAGVKDWGDGTTNSETTHTYSSPGVYTITCYGSALPEGTGSASGMFGSSSSAYDYICTAVYLGEDITSIPTYCFEYTDHMKYVTLPNGITISAGWTFNYNKELTAIILPKSVTTVGNASFYPTNARLKVLSLPDTLNVAAGTSNFCEFSAVEHLTIPSACTRVPSHNDTPLTKIVYPEGITNPSARQLKGTKIEKLTLPKTVTELPTYFCDTNTVILRELICKGNIKSLGMRALSVTNNLRLLDMRNTKMVPQLSSQSYVVIDQHYGKIIVPGCLVDEWKTATNWTYFSQYIEADPNMLYRYTPKAIDVTSGTTLSLSIACNIGDMIVAAFIVRNQSYTLSDGWTLLAASEFGNNQITGVCYKIATAPSETLTVTQASSGRIYINFARLSGAIGITCPGFTSVSRARSITRSRPNGLVIWVAGSMTWSTSSPYLPWEVSNNNEDEIASIQLTTNAPRLLMCLDQGDDPEMTFTIGTTDNSDWISCAPCVITGIPNFWQEVSAQ